MKRIFIILILGFYSLSIQSQDLDVINQQNVFFLLFDAKDTHMRKFDLSRNKKDTIFNYVYSFYNKKKKKIEEYDFSFYYSKYPTFDDEYNEINESMLFRINKSFLRKNKDIIITRKLIERIGEDVITELFAGVFDHVFLIDKSEIKNKKILVREVRFNFVANE